MCVLCGRCVGPCARVCGGGGGVVWGGGAGRDVSVCVCGLACVACGQRQRQSVTARQRTTQCVCVGGVCVFVGARRCVVFSVACGAV